MNTMTVLASDVRPGDVYHVNAGLVSEQAVEVTAVRRVHSMVIVDLAVGSPVVPQADSLVKVTR